MSEKLHVGTFNVRWANPDDGEHQWELRRARRLIRENRDILLSEWRLIHG